MPGNYDCGTYSFGSTGAKFLALNLNGDTPKAVRVTVGARVNTTETADIHSVGFSNGGNSHCTAKAPGVTKNWPYTGEPNYLFAAYNTAGTKVLSGTFDAFDVDEVDVTVDVANSNYQILLEAWS